MKHLTESYNFTFQSLEDSLEKYLKNLPATPISLPIKTKIIFEKRNISIDHIIIMPIDNGAKLYEFLLNYFKNLGDEVIEIVPDSFLCVLRHNDMMENIVKIDRETKLFTIEMISGEIVYFKGDVVLKSEGKKNCFSLDFDKSKQYTVKYLSCETCNLNWICEGCAKNCHKEHKIKLFKDNHLATWACCYCYKTNCILPNKYNQK